MVGHVPAVACSVWLALFRTVRLAGAVRPFGDAVVRFWLLAVLVDGASVDRLGCVVLLLELFCTTFGSYSLRKYKSIEPFFKSLVNPLFNILIFLYFSIVNTYAPS
jgi:hypothetical protein